MPRRYLRGKAILLAALLATIPSGSIAQRYVPMGYGGWHGGYPAAHYGYGYGGYRPYYGYRAYHPYYGGYYGYPVWGVLGAVIGAIMAPPPPVYVYAMPPPPPPPAPPPIQQCPDGSTVPMGEPCAVAAPVAPAPAPAPVPQAPLAPAPQPAPERG